MTGEVIRVRDGLLVLVYELNTPLGGTSPVAEVWQADEQAHEHFTERRSIEGQLCGRVGTRRRGKGPEQAARVAQGEHALATQTFRQAGIKPDHVSQGRAWLRELVSA